MIILYFLYCKLMQLLKKNKIEENFYETVVFFKFFFKILLKLGLRENIK